MDRDEVEETARQGGWKELSEAVRDWLCKEARRMPEMNPTDLKTFVEACRQARWLDEDAAAFDKDVELRNNRIVFTN